ncbi:hypothetical protein [Actinokineospora iranica]|uniref:Uncharacterized protein n=1 Tax=Actinokineospora iranica TaxID=1271860 RepID=A0A1G6T193_9PSEU|nr:hypothetical protein [Actinokineospora iranica]SDD22789.1 hypothetical protein SAMN05216174_108307 [Actinokineospora iranica]
MRALGLFFAALIGLAVVSGVPLIEPLPVRETTGQDTLLDPQAPTSVLGDAESADDTAVPGQAAAPRAPGTRLVAGPWATAFSARADVGIARAPPVAR